MDFPDLYIPCVTVVKALTGVTGYSANGKALSVGIENPQGWEYPFWRIARHEGVNARFCFIGRTSISVPGALNELDAVIVLNPNPGWSAIGAGLGSFPEKYATPKARILTRTVLK